MFSGIIRQFATLDRVENNAVGRRLVVGVPMIELRTLELGTSVALNGVCFTLVKKGLRSFEVETMPQTLRVTTVGSWKEGDRLNFEGSLKVGDEIAGHMVYGHVDQVGVIKRCLYEGVATVMEIEAPKEVAEMIFPRASIAIDGVSLTVVDRKDQLFRVSLLPETLKRTTFGERKAGDKVNIEIDMLARYAYQFLQQRER